ncbi:MAG: hypothetical protein F6K16_13350 [Symploca sp. SIO2B6]|nr:hypothetical protein [Symploca sp. SIO2B6]
MKNTLFTGSTCLLLAIGTLKPAPAAITTQTPSVIAQLTNDSLQPTATVEAEVELLDPGAEPRQELRFQPQVNLKQTSIMTMKMNMAMSLANNPMSGVNLPTMVMTMETIVTKIDANGDIHYQSSCTDADVVVDDNVPPEVSKAMQEQIKQIIGLGGSFVADNRGRTKQGNFVVPEGIDENIKPMLKQMSNSLEQFSYPLPEAAVGIGAKWRVSNLLNLNSMNLNQTAHYELVSFEDDVAILEVSMQQQAEPQELNPPGMPSGTILTLTSHDAQGQGNVKMPLNQIMPLSSSFSMISNTQMQFKQAGSNQETVMGSKLSVEMTLESAI